MPPTGAVFLARRFADGIDERPSRHHLGYALDAILQERFDDALEDETHDSPRCIHLLFVPDSQKLKRFFEIALPPCGVLESRVLVVRSA